MRIVYCIIFLINLMPAKAQVFIEPEIFVPYGLPYELRWREYREFGLNPLVSTKRITLLSVGGEIELGYKFGKNAIKAGYQRMYMRTKECTSKCLKPQHHSATGVGSDTVSYFYFAKHPLYVSLNTLNKVPITYSRELAYKKTRLNASIGFTLPLTNRHLNNNTYNISDKSDKTEHPIDHGLSIFGGLEVVKSNKSKKIEYFFGIHSEVITDLMNPVYSKYYFTYTEEGKVFFRGKIGVRFNLGKKQNKH